VAPSAHLLDEVAAAKEEEEQVRQMPTPHVGVVVKGGAREEDVVVEWVAGKARRLERTGMPKECLQTIKVGRKAEVEAAVVVVTFVDSGPLLVLVIEVMTVALAMIRL
jgi:hypothetical protein